MKFQELLKPSLRDVKPYKPGKPVEELQRELGLNHVVKIASNENALGVPPAAVEAICAAATGLALYPDGSGYKLREELAAKHGVSMDRIVLGSGSDDLICLLAAAFINPGENAVTSEHSFLRYGQAVRIQGGQILTVPMKDWCYDLEAIAGRVNEITRLVYLANPNNPTGTIFTEDATREFLSRITPRMIPVFDEAYYDYVGHPDFPQSLELMKEFPEQPMITLRSFSKVFGLAGLRIGYAVTSHPELATCLNLVRGPFNVNSLAQAAALACLQKAADWPAQSAEFNRRERDKIADGIRNLGLTPIPSEANFLLVDTGGNGDQLAQALLQEGVIVRAMGDWGLPPEMVRISIGRPEENDYFLNVLQTIIQAGGHRPSAITETVQ